MADQGDGAEVGASSAPVFAGLAYKAVNNKEFPYKALNNKECM